MFRSSYQLGIPRKVVAYYLLFCLIAVSWLGIGILYKSYALMDSRATSTCLSRLGKIAAALELDYLVNGNDNLQHVLSDQQRTSELKSYAVVDLEGKILAHNDENLIGQQIKDVQGNRLSWGEVSGIQFLDEHGYTVNEYRVPLVAHEEHFGTLRISVQQPSFWTTLTDILRIAPLAILAPLALIAVGAITLERLARPIATIDSQLRQIALQRPTAEIKIETLETKDAVAIGWNKIAETMKQLQSVDGGDNLESRLGKVMNAQRQGEMQEVLHNLSDGIAVTNAEGRIKFVNRAVSALLALETTDSELDDLEFEGQLLHTCASSATGALFEQDTAHRPVVAEIEREVDGGSRTLRVARIPLESKSMHGHVWSIRDVTQQKLTERTRDQFIDVATHELRTPLSNIKAYAETLATSDSIELEDQKEFCNIINGEVTRLARFVDDLLSISSMEAGSIVIERQRTIASRLFEEVISKVRPLMNRKSIEFQVKLPEKMSDLHLDKDKVVAVLVNLLGNAAKYTPDNGRVSMRVKCDDSQLQIDVEDTGVGITTDELPKVFDKFFRSSDPRVQNITGTGLGLTLAREVIRMHGGDITVESQIDQGTTFMATIPIR